MQDILRDAEARMIKAVETTANNFALVQTGRASDAVWDGVSVN